MPLKLHLIKIIYYSRYLLYFERSSISVLSYVVVVFAINKNVKQPVIIVIILLWFSLYTHRFNFFREAVCYSFSSIHVKPVLADLHSVHKI